MPRCSATTTGGKRCRCSAGEDGLCASHRAHGDKKLPPPRLGAKDAGYAKFCRSYYDILRELYNVAGEEMQEEYIRYRTIGRAAFNDLHSKRYSGFRSRIE